MAQKTKKRIRRNAADAKGSILTESIRLFGENGIDQTSFAMIAKATKVTQPNVLYHFPSKEILVHEMVQRILIHNRESVESLMKPGDSGRDKLEKYLLGNLAWAKQYPDDTRVILLLYYYATFRPEFRDLYASILKSARARLEGFLQCWVREENKDLEQPLDLLAQILHDWVLGAVINHLTTASVRLSAESSLRKKWSVLLENIA
jgi:AcrR family transcriptional regulator